MRRLVEQAIERIVPHVASLPAQPAADQADGAALARSLIEDAPEGGAPFDGLLDQLFELVGHSYNTAGPGYLAYIPGGGLFQSAVADLIASAVNRYVGVFVAAPGLVQLEANVIRWFCRMVGYGDAAGGVLTSGGSLANFTALFTARRERLGDQLDRGTMYVSEQAHHSVMRAAVLAGFRPAQVRRVGVDDRFRLRLPSLAEAIAADRAGGLTPFLVVGSGGTTNSGAVDDLAAISELARRERLWFHVDAAYGGFFALTERGRRALAGIDRADSITLDPHKGLFLPYGTGCLLAADRGTLKRAHSIVADYMPRFQESDDLVDFCELSPELSRDFRGLRVWLPIKMHGLGAFRAALDEKLDLARAACAAVRRIEAVEIVAEPELSLLAFRLRDEDPARGDARTRALVERVNAGGRVFITGTTMAGRFAARFCILSFRTHADRVEEALAAVRAAVAAEADKGPTSR